MISAKFDQLKSREKIGLVVALLCVLLVLADRFAVRWVVDRIRSVETEIRTELDQLLVNLDLIAAEPAVAAGYEPLRVRLETAPSEAVAIDRLKGRIDDLARRHGLVIQAMRDRKVAEPNDPYLKIAVEIGRFEAEIESLIAFLFALREAPEIWRVTRLNITPDQSGRLSGSMTIVRLTELVDRTAASSPNELALHLNAGL